MAPRPSKPYPGVGEGNDTHAWVTLVVVVLIYASLFVVAIATR